MKFAIACGGTGGHVYPGLSVANSLRGRGHDVVLLGTGRSVEQLAMKEWHGETVFTGPEAYTSCNAILKILKLWGSRSLSIGMLRSIEPDALLAMGGYASIGPVLAARKLGIPVILHEGNSIPGKALRFLARFADVVAVNFESTKDFLQGIKTVTTGFPVRADVVEAAKQSQDRSESFNLLIIGGSQGAAFLNEKMPRVVDRLVADGQRVHALHIAGESMKEAVEKTYNDLNLSAEVYGFINGMTDIYSRSDAAAARSGASVCAELAVFGLPSLLVPYPFAADDHQSINAKHYSEAGAAKVFAEDSFNENDVGAFFKQLIASREQQKKMRNAMLACASIDAAGAVADIVEETGGKHANL